MDAKMKRFVSLPGLSYEDERSSVHAPSYDAILVLLVVANKEAHMHALLECGPERLATYTPPNIIL